MIKNLKQEPMDFPFLALNPKYKESGGFKWWTKKLNPLIKRLKSKYDYYNSLKYLSNTVGNLEIIPYHSKQFKPNSALLRLESIRLTCNYISHLLNDKNKLTIIMRKVDYISDILGINLHSLKKENLIVFPTNEARAAHLHKYTDRIMKFLGK